MPIVQMTMTDGEAMKLGMNIAKVVTNQRTIHQTKKHPLKSLAYSKRP